MLILHAVWIDGRLHVWGERVRGLSESDPTPQNVHPAGMADASNRVTCDILDTETLSGTVGDIRDGLLVSSAVPSRVALRLPHRDGRLLSSVEDLAVPTDEPDTDGATDASACRVQLIPLEISTLAFSPADAVDFLTGSSPVDHDEIETGASLRFWARVARLTMSLLARQRFVPAIRQADDETYHAYWRVVADDQETSGILAAMVTAMPPICRAYAASFEVVQAAALVEDFLWRTVDALVRRCAEGDELTHALRERSDARSSPLLCWLRAIVGGDSRLDGPDEVCRRANEVVSEWLVRLTPADAERSYRTCFRLHPPQTSGASSPSGVDAEVEESIDRCWRLTIHLQSIHDPSFVVDADDLTERHRPGPQVLKRPFDLTLQQLRAELTRAAHRFPPLRPCADKDGPLACELGLDEAYSFLRDATPILENEGFVVWPPRGWRDMDARLRLWLHVSPVGSDRVRTDSAIRLDTVVSYDWKLAAGDLELTEQELLQLAAAKKPLVQVHGRWMEVQPSEVQSALRFLRRHGSGRMTVLEALRQCYIADDLDTGVPVVGLRAHGWIDELLNASTAVARMEHINPPAHFQGSLRPYQLRGLSWLMFLSRFGIGACLADDMGLGKTIQLIALLLAEREGGEPPGPTLLIVPMSLVGNWLREINRFAPSLRVMIHHGTERLSGDAFVEEVRRFDVVVSTYALIPRDLEHVAAVDWHRVALDEAQNIKNPAAKQSTAIRSLRAVQRVGLTGTPVENHLSELWSIMDFLNAGYLGSAGDFRRRFAVPIERHHDPDRASRLRHLIQPFVLRRLKSDPTVQVDLPEKMEMKVYCNLTREQAALYQAMVDEVLVQVDRAGGIQRRGMILAALVKLKQICNHPAHFLGDGSTLAHRSGKCDRLVEMLEEVLAEGDRALIFSQFRVMGELLCRLVRDTLGCEPLFLHGGTTRRNRDAMVERFQSEADDVPLLILSLKAGGYGLNLTAASHVFHFDRWWNPAAEDQATDRTHRIGQSKRVQVHKFVCAGTLEERIDAVLDRKRNLAEQIVGSGEDWLTSLSTEKLREILTLSRDAVADY